MTYKRFLSKYVLLLIGAVAIILLTTSQKPPENTTKPPLTDSTLILSIRDVNAFNTMLKQSASFDQYTKLTPEATLSELVNWKVRQLQSDTTKPKK